MTFEEQFPSLINGFDVDVDILKLLSDVKFNYTETQSIRCKKCNATHDEDIHLFRLRMYIEQDIQKHCLDKQKVRDAIKTIMSRPRLNEEFVDGYKFKVELEHLLNLED